MSNTRTIAATSAAIVVVGVALTRYSFHQMLYARFPSIDHKIVRQAYGRMMWKSLTGKYDLDYSSDAEMDLLFLREVDAITL